jgi:exopolyphosphatase/guanosine-5'-triphosphate,3'-diphosphate pyrophosphatase
MPRYAAIDIGSNSIRLLAAEVDASLRLQTLAEDRQVTRLGESVFRAGSVSREAMEATLGELGRMAAAARQLDALAMRVVATAAVRDASNRAEFLERASETAGVPVEMISGQEEARLIHLGVQSRWPHREERILVIDIGGGSAELIVAEEGRLRLAFSRPLGAVRVAGMFLRKDPAPESDLRRMNEYIEEKLAVAVQRIGSLRFHRAIATAATASAVICAANRIPRARRGEADRRRASAVQVRRLYRRLAGLDLEARRKVTGIGPRRAEIILPGAAVLLQVVERFRLPSLFYSAAGVRDGIVYDLASRGAGREVTRLARDQRQRVEGMARRFGVDLVHARQVASFAHILFESLLPLHRLPREQGRLLEAAAYLRDTGHYISDTSHHKHSHYIVANADLAGFTDAERRMVALLCRYHRKAAPSARHEELTPLPAEDRRALNLLTPLLRLADGLDRGREGRVDSLACSVDNGAVRLVLRGRRDISLEQWAVERAAESFRDAYQRPIEIARESL